MWKWVLMLLIFFVCVNGVVVMVENRRVMGVKWKR